MSCSAITLVRDQELIRGRSATLCEVIPPSEDTRHLWDHATPDPFCRQRRFDSVAEKVSGRCAMRASDAHRARHSYGPHDMSLLVFRAQIDLSEPVWRNYRLSDSFCFTPHSSHASSQDACTVGHRSHDPSFNVFLMGERVMTFVAHCRYRRGHEWFSDFIFFKLCVGTTNVF